MPKFEIGEMSGDEAGEAQLFYENYCPDCEEIEIPNSTPTAQFREPAVVKGTAVTADSYWKGAEYHENAGHIAEYYECPDKYAVIEMEEIGIMNAAECFGLKDRVISLRVIVIDAVLAGEL